MNFSPDNLHRLGGITGLGWTTSMLGYLTTVVGVGGSYATRLFTDPHSFLYAGGIFFLATLGLDRLAQSGTEEKP
ncbi:hypothetical protein [Halorussus halophilus]|uniref:hypothetical protein n=1 Tax=Halorussus halophilus TaxID=2650975 RepID=UPI001300DCE6|nr:hypothetical protein [Halorussus halophilus]